MGTSFYHSSWLLGRQTEARVKPARFVERSALNLSVTIGAARGKLALIDRLFLAESQAEFEVKHLMKSLTLTGL